MGRGELHVCGRRRRGLLRGLGLGGGLLVQEAGEVGADVDDAAQDLAVGLGVCGLVAGVVLVGGWR